ncbi:MAG: hypothetical protein HC809_01035 [Gammaproteobacteria bacterium]|nr:hypothetical protein [Gammaproteobacteria bacterium]
MADVTVKELAATVGAPVDRLLKQMQDAGLPHTKDGEAVSEEQKQELLAFLKRSHGESASAPRKITLTRKSVGTLKAGGQGKGRTVAVEVRKKRTYVKRGEAGSSPSRHRRRRAKLRSGASPNSRPSAFATRKCRAKVPKKRPGARKLSARPRTNGDARKPRNRKNRSAPPKPKTRWRRMSTRPLNRPPKPSARRQRRKRPKPVVVVSAQPRNAVARSPVRRTSSTMADPAAASYR